ncbi:hypothetical protein HQ560_14480, partial [bacterium]|nr:hypothetical protein [bacterium]
MSLLPSTYRHSVAAIGVQNDDGTTFWVGTGFFYGHLVAPAGEGRRYDLTFLVTNRHVVEALGGKPPVIRYNSEDGAAANERPLFEYRDLTAPPPRGWQVHDEVDVAVAFPDFARLESTGAVSYFMSGVATYSVQDMRNMGVS